MSCPAIDKVIQASLLAWSASKSYPCLPPFFFHLLNFQLHHFVASIFPFIPCLHIQDTLVGSKSSWFIVGVCVLSAKATFASNQSLVVCLYTCVHLLRVAAFVEETDLGCGLGTAGKLDQAQGSLPDSQEGVGECDMCPSKVFCAC